MKSVIYHIFAMALLVACNPGGPGDIKASFAYPACRSMGGVGVEDSFSCGGSSCSFDVVGDESTICKVDADALERTGLQYNIADGYDVITDKTKPSCLASGVDVVEEVEVHRTHDEFDIVRDHKSFYEKTTTTKKVGVGGFFGWLFGGGYSRTRQSVSENSSRSDSFHLAASFTYIAKEMSFVEKNPYLTPLMKQLLFANPKNFRSKCGDKYIETAMEGGKLVLSFKANFSSDRSYSKESVEKAFKIGLGGLFSVSTNETRTKEVTELLETMKITSSCTTVGASPELCVNHQLDEETFKLTDNALKARIQKAKEDLVSGILDGQMAAVDVKLADYPLSVGENKNYFDYFHDYRGMRERLIKWSDDYLRIEENCENFDISASACTTSKNDFETLVDLCMKQSSWESEDCSKETLASTSINKVLNLGTIKLYQGSNKTESSYLVDLSNLSVNSEIVPNKVYNVTAYPFKLIDVSSVDYNLSDGWKIVFYTKANGQGERLHVATEGQMRSGNFSSFQIIQK